MLWGENLLKMLNVHAGWAEMERMARDDVMHACANENDHESDHNTESADHVVPTEPENTANTYEVIKKQKKAMY